MKKFSVVLFVVGLATPALAVNSISVYKTFATEILTSSDLNNSFTRILDGVNTLAALHPGDSTKTAVASFDTLTSKSLARIILDKEIESITSDDSLDLHRARIKHIKADTLGSDSLTVSGPLIVAGNLKVVNGATGNVGIGGVTSWGTSAEKVIGIGDGTAPSSSPADMVQLYADGANAELIVRDEAGNTTTLSPHTFDLVTRAGQDSLPWTFHSEKDGKVIEVDMLRLASEVERLTGRKLIFYGKKGANGTEVLSP